MIELMHLAPAGLDPQEDEVPPEIQSLLHKFQSMFDSPADLPPRRACDHKIPLIPGASPVFYRPYRYGPAMKDEIENQVAEMLKAGIIQTSTSPFSSQRKKMVVGGFASITEDLTISQ
jgi:hypothetical protein